MSAYSAPHTTRRAVFAVWTLWGARARLWLQPGGWTAAGSAALYLPESAQRETDHWRGGAGVVCVGAVRPYSLLLRQASAVRVAGAYRISRRTWRRRRMYWLGRAA